jgi:hypothetical protein
MDSTRTLPNVAAPAPDADRLVGALEADVRYAGYASQGGAGSAADKLDPIGAAANSGVDEVAETAGELGQKGTEALADASWQIRERAVEVSNAAAAYAREEPVRALLFAAATGALLMAVLRMMVGSKD